MQNDSLSVAKAEEPEANRLLAGSTQLSIPMTNSVAAGLRQQARRERIDVQAVKFAVGIQVGGASLINVDRTVQQCHHEDADVEEVFGAVAVQIAR